jgi:hypothetical protein
MSDDCFFSMAADGMFIPGDHSRGPWNPDHCHAGPPTGLLARALERQLPDQRLTRITVDLTRPIPMAGFTIETSIVRQGRMVSRSSAVLIDRTGRECASAAGLHISAQAKQDFPSHHTPIDSPEDAVAGSFPLRKVLHDKKTFAGDGVQLRYPAGESPEPGPTTAWMKTVPLLADETPSPFQRICPLADCGNAFGRNAEPWETSFINPDLTVVLHRDPVGDWLGSRAVGYWESNGIGLADAALFDASGMVGRALQTLLLQKL